MEYNNYQQMTVPTLKHLVREKGLRGYSRLNKAELIKKISEKQHRLENPLEKS